MVDKYLETENAETDVHIPDRFINFVLLRNIEIRGLFRTHLPPEVEEWDGSLQDGFISFKYRELGLRIGIRAHCWSAPQQEIINRELSRKAVDALRAALRDMAREASEADLNALTQFGIRDLAMLVLQFVDETTSCVRSWRSSQLKATDISQRGWNAKEAKHWTEVKDNEYGVDLDSVEDTASDILGKTPKEVCEDILPKYRVIHCETVIRNDMLRHFKQRQRKLRESLLDKRLNDLKQCVPIEQRRDKGGRERQKEQMVDYLVTPRLTFHGTRTDQIASVVQYGFLKHGDTHPATGLPLPVRCGSTYGQGIYTSPDPTFSLRYSGRAARASKSTELSEMKLIVCATIMGRSAQMRSEDDWREQSEPYPGADSHVANKQQEYIVFDAAQVLPCYVLHLDLKAVDAEEFLKNQLNNNRKDKPTHAKLHSEVLSPGDTQRLKQERIARAAKFFAYGFGPVSGSNIVIEDIAEIDDDDEEYGDYQENRLEGEMEEADIWSWAPLSGETAFDEYARARKSKAKN